MKSPEGRASAAPRRLVAVLRPLAFALCLFLLACVSTEKKQESKARYKMGVSHLSSNQYQAAFVEFQKAMNLNPKDKEVHNALGIVYMKLEQPGEAEDHFLTAVKLDDEYSEAYNNLCYLYHDMGRFEGAMAQCLKALENPLYATPEKAFYNLGRVYYRLRDYSSAAESFNSAIIRYPTYVSAFYGLALAYNAKRMFGEASVAMDKALMLDPRFKGGREKAEEEFRKRLAVGGQDAKDASDYLEILKY